MTRLPLDAVDPDRVRVGISSCLLGEEVRYDGGHKRDRYVTQVLARHFELVSFCPEVAIGLDVPRPPIHLRGDPADPRAVGVDDPSLDVTDALDAYGHRVAAAIDGLSGYLFKKDSPSCGVWNVRIHPEHGEGAPARTGTGRYAAAIRTQRPLLPVEEEGRLGDPALRDQFVLRVLVYHRWQCLRAAGATPARLVAFHAEHEYLLPAHDPQRYRRMGRLVAGAGRGDPDALADAYAAELMAALEKPAGRRAHYNALQHAAGQLRGRIDAGERAGLHDAIERYAAGDAPLVEPMTLLRHHRARHGSDWLARRRYLDARPARARDPHRPARAARFGRARDSC